LDGKWYTASKVQNYRAETIGTNGSSRTQLFCAEKRFAQECQTATFMTKKTSGNGGLDTFAAVHHQTKIC
jgi:hypothetical protein